MRTGTKLFTGILLTLALMLALAAPALAVSEPADRLMTPYMDTSHEYRDAPDCKSVTEWDKEWSTGWYTAPNSVSMYWRVMVSGDVNLLLGDGVTLTVQRGITVSEGSSLTIWAQSTGDNMGVLYAGTTEDGSNFCDYQCAGIGGGELDDKSGTITINGGAVTATGGSGGAGIGGSLSTIEKVNDNCGAIIVNGGKVTATGNDGGAGIGGDGNTANGNITINGGVVLTGSYGGTVKLGHDFRIKKSDGSLGVVLAATDDGNVPAELLSHMAGVTLIPCDSAYAIEMRIQPSFPSISGAVSTFVDSIPVTRAVEGQNVKLTVEEVSGYVPGSLSYTPRGGTETILQADESGACSFVMPGKDVTVSVPFEHLHSVAYSAKENVITAECGVAGCAMTDNNPTLTIAAPAHMLYDDGKDPEAVIIDEYGIRGEDATVSYYAAARSESAYTKTGSALAAAPTDAGDYVAELTVGTGDNRATASIGYTVLQREPIITGAELVLDGTLNLRLHVFMPEGPDYSGAHMAFSIYGRSCDIPISEAGTAADGKRTFDCPVYSIEMAEPVSAVFHYRQNGMDRTAEIRTSVQDYLNALDKLSGKSSELADLITATRNYGHYMQPYLNRLHGVSCAEITKGSDITPVSASDVSQFSRQWFSYDPSVIQSNMYNLTLNESVTLNIQLKLRSAPAYYSATVNDKDWPVEKLDSTTYLIRIPGIAANDLGTSYAVAFKAKGSISFGVRMSALTYVYSVLNKGQSDTDEILALSALYKYYVAANAYQSVQK